MATAAVKEKDAEVMQNQVAEQKQQETGLSNSEKFTNKVLKEFGQSAGGEFRVTDFQRQLISGYFIGIDRALKAAEERRVADNAWKKEANNDPITWNTIDLNAVALDVMHYARMGLDITQKNMLFAIPYKDNNRTAKTGTKLYSVNFMQGYNGIRYIAEKYALEKPKSVTTELVYSTDVFKPIKKSHENNVESYEFSITNAFDRGEIVGGFGYIEYADPTKNRLIIMSKKDIEKRKPKYASAEFWGTEATGKKVTQYVNGKKEQVDTEGWYEEMCLKTIRREVYSPKNIPIDPQKIDESYQYMKEQELRYAQMEAQDLIEANTASEVIDIPEDAARISDVVDTETGEIKQANNAPAEKAENPTVSPLDDTPFSDKPDADGQIAMPGF